MRNVAQPNGRTTDGGTTLGLTLEKRYTSTFQLGCRMVPLQGFLINNPLGFNWHPDWEVLVGAKLLYPQSGSLAQAPRNTHSWGPASASCWCLGWQRKNWWKETTSKGIRYNHPRKIVITSHSLSPSPPKIDFHHVQQGWVGVKKPWEFNLTLLIKTFVWSNLGWKF